MKKLIYFIVIVMMIFVFSGSNCMKDLIMGTPMVFNHTLTVIGAVHSDSWALVEYHSGNYENFSITNENTLIKVPVDESVEWIIEVESYYNDAVRIILKVYSNDVGTALIHEEIFGVSASDLQDIIFDLNTL